jgi:hypothetical protein
MSALTKPWSIKPEPDVPSVKMRSPTASPRHCQEESAIPDVAALSEFIEKSAALAGETLEVEIAGQVADSSIFQPNSQNHWQARRPPHTERFFNSTLLRQSTVSADREQIKQPSQPGVRHCSTQYE